MHFALCLVHGIYPINICLYFTISSLKVRFRLGIYLCHALYGNDHRVMSYSPKTSVIGENCKGKNA